MVWAPAANAQTGRRTPDTGSPEGAEDEHCQDAGEHPKETGFSRNTYQYMLRFAHMVVAGAASPQKNCTRVAIFHLGGGELLEVSLPVIFQRFVWMLSQVELANDTARNRRKHGKILNDITNT